MPVSAAERRFVLDNLTRLAEADIQRMWRAAELQTDVEFAAYVTQAFPEIVDPYQQLAAQTGATFFEEDFPEIVKPPLLVPPLPPEQLATSAQWALGADGVEAISRMAGTAQRAIFDGERNTTALNARRNGMRWVRVARPDACAFCRLLASRTANSETYAGSGTRQKVGIDPETGEPYADGIKTTVVYGRRRTDAKRPPNEEYHDDCRCTAKAIPRGENPMDYLSATEPQFADLAAQWNNEYNKARDKAESGDPKKILAKWRAFGDDIA
jgi:hypothetical protein